VILISTLVSDQVEASPLGPVTTWTLLLPALAMAAAIAEPKSTPWVGRLGVVVVVVDVVVTVGDDVAVVVGEAETTGGFTGNSGASTWRFAYRSARDRLGKRRVGSSRSTMTGSVAGSGAGSGAGSRGRLSLVDAERFA
jgi:hypothetical protein